MVTIPERLIARRPPAVEPLRSQLASAAQTDDARFVGWMTQLGYEASARHRYDRKIWEWCFILEALRRNGAIYPGSRALGFGIGRERLPALLASYGVHVVATDQGSETAAAWASTGQHAAALEALRFDGVCLPERFEELVSFRPVDMNDIPTDLEGFDGLWSSCAFEHLGSPAAGCAFVLESLNCLRAGGVAVHTTEVAIDSRSDVDLEGVVLYSTRTLRRLVARLRLSGHGVVANFYVPSEHEADRYVDEAPYPHDPYHLKLAFGGHVTTSFGLIVRKRRAGWRDRLYRGSPSPRATSRIP